MSDDEQQMTPAEHIAAAERLLLGADRAAGGSEFQRRYLRAAEVHAQIAQAQAVAEGVILLSEINHTLAFNADNR